MRLRFLLGLALVAGAFAAAAAELAARQVTNSVSLMSAYDLWYALRPGSLVVAEARVERLLHPLVWDPVITTILAVPAWLLLGVPGLVLLWRFNPRRGETDIDEDAMFLFDRLAKRAREEGYDDTPPTYTPPPRVIEQDWDDAEKAVPFRRVPPERNAEMQEPLPQRLPMEYRVKPGNGE